MWKIVACALVVCAELCFAGSNHKHDMHHPTDYRYKIQDEVTEQQTADLLWPEVRPLISVANMLGPLVEKIGLLKPATACPHKDDCPTFKREHVCETYEERDYDKSSWVRKSVQADNLSYSVYTDLYQSLENYVELHDLPMKKGPVVTTIRKIQGSTKNNYTMAFYLPNLDKTPPQDSSSEIFIINKPKTKVYARQFGGFAYTEKIWKDQLPDLEKALKDDGKTAPKDYLPSTLVWGIAMYDEPIKPMVGRRNEVWLMKPDKVTLRKIIKANKAKNKANKKANKKAGSST